MRPDVIEYNFIKGQEKHKASLEIIYRCTMFDCSKLFINTYKYINIGYGTMSEDLKLYSSIPTFKTKPDIPNEVIEISPNFFEVYHQAHLAELYNLNEIAGTGYRKALEFLIKDYCISRNKDKEANIKELPLAKVIGQYVEDMNIKDCAKRAVWIGNDETHYVKIWASKNIKDLKILIQLTVGWVKNCVLTAKYMKDMPQVR